MIDLGGVAAVLGGTGVLVSAVGGFVVSLRTSKLTKDTHAMVRQVDVAVNGKPPGETTMVQQVQEMRDAMPDPPPSHPPEAPHNGNGDAILPLLRRLAADIAELRASQP